MKDPRKTLWDYMPNIIRLMPLVVIPYTLASGCKDNSPSNRNLEGAVERENNRPAGRPQNPDGTYTVTISWDPPRRNEDGTRLTDLAGYNIYAGPSSGKYEEVFDAGLERELSLDVSEGTHFFTVTAYDVHGNESTFSEEVSKTVP